MAEKTTTPTAADFMTAHVCTVTPDTPLADVIHSLLKHKTSNAPVVEEVHGKKRLVGFISEGDCLDYLSNEVFFGNPSPPQVAKTIMKLHPVCVDPGTELFALASIFVSHNYRHLPVVDQDEVVGIVSRRDVLKAMDAHYRGMLSAKEKKRSPLDLRDIINKRFVVKH